jgi:hypothetical protein
MGVGVDESECVAEIRQALMRMNNASEENWRSSFRSCVATGSLSQEATLLFAFKNAVSGRKASVI